MEARCLDPLHHNCFSEEILRAAFFALVADITEVESNQKARPWCGEEDASGPLYSRQGI